jgi:hypothetical protein
VNIRTHQQWAFQQEVARLDLGRMRRNKVEDHLGSTWQRAGKQLGEQTRHLRPSFSSKGSSKSPVSGMRTLDSLLGRQTVTLSPSGLPRPEGRFHATHMEGELAWQNMSRVFAHDFGKRGCVHLEAGCHNAGQTIPSLLAVYKTASERSVNHPHFTMRLRTDRLSSQDKVPLQ